MSEVFTSLGLMTGTSADGLDISLIKSDGESFFQEIKDEYFDYSNNISERYIDLREKVLVKKDISKFKNEIDDLERDITIFHAECIKKFNIQDKKKFDLIGFHGQTIYHNAKEKISLQLGNGNLLSQLLKSTVINDFRSEDLLANGQGAPLTPIFHELLVKKFNLLGSTVILNIGGIANITLVDEKNKSLHSSDIGPGNCLIDKWIKKKTNFKYDENGNIAYQGQINKIIYEQAIEQWHYKLFENIDKNLSFDINDFDFSFIRGLSLEDGAATLTEYTAEIISKYLNSKTFNNIIICGGGRKNNFLLERIRKKISKKIVLMDTMGINGDFIESKAFAYIAIRSLKKLPISFPNTTGCLKPTSGGSIHKIK